MLAAPGGVETRAAAQLPRPRSAFAALAQQAQEEEDLLKSEAVDGVATLQPLPQRRSTKAGLHGVPSGALGGAAPARRSISVSGWLPEHVVKARAQ
jgi:hypothetical protein